MNIIPLHGAVGSWDEIICLALPATVIMAIFLLVARQERGQGEAQDQERDGAVEPHPGPSPSPATGGVADPTAGRQAVASGGDTPAMQSYEAKHESEVKG